MARRASSRVEEEATVYSFGFEGAPKAFHVGVVLAMGLAAHARDQAVSFEGLLVEDAGVLDTLVAVMDDARRHLSSPDQRLTQRGVGQCGIKSPTHGQAEHTAAALVQHSRPHRAQPSFVGDVGDVANPNLIRLARSRSVAQ